MTVCSALSLVHLASLSVPCCACQEPQGQESQEFILTERTAFNFVCLDCFICPENTFLNHIEVGQIATFV